MNDLYDLWDKDSIIDRTNLGNESLRQCQLHSKYSKLLTNERLKLKKIEIQRDILKHEKYEMYHDGPTEEQMKKGWKLPPKGKIILKSDIDRYLSADNEIIEMNIKVAMARERVEYLERAMDMIRGWNFQIKSFIDYEKFLAGV